ncbi:MAG: FAD-dependent oxidoreductase [Minicystis sp.]
MQKKVAIFGGGIGGLSCALELAEQGLDVHVYEAGPAVGGKARSQAKAGTGTDGREDLPGEHGFRFFPAFYRHIIHTMRRIPFSGRRTVADNLVGCDEMALAEAGRGAKRLPRHSPSSIGDFFQIVNAVEAFFAGSDIESGDLARFAGKMLEFLCSCDERRFGIYENVSFWRFVQGDRYGERFQRYIDASRFMVAMDARRGSARTIGAMVIQLLLDFRRPAGQNDRVLDGPTTARWIAPWEAHLRSLGVTFHMSRPLLGLSAHPTDDRITAAHVGGETAPIEADYYVLAVPIERVAACLGAVADRDPLLRKLVAAQHMTAWMVGAQFYLGGDVKVCRGHVGYPDSPWALSSISQAQFWEREGAPAFEQRYGDGRTKGILSVDICDWERSGRLTRRPAALCTSAEEVLAEVWVQLKDALNGGGEVLLRDEDRIDWRLDANVSFTEAGAMNSSPLLMHPPRSWWSRPEASSTIENLMFAADYVRTTTDLATMEGANEAARMAANAIFAREGRPRSAEIFPLVEDAGRLVALAKRIDHLRWEKDKNEPSFSTLNLRAGEEPTLERVRARQADVIAKLCDIDASGAAP